MVRRWVLNLSVSSFLAFSIYLGFSLILPLLPLYISELGGGGLEVGLLMAAFMLTRAFLARPFGRLSDRIGRKKVIITGMFLYSILAFLFTLPDDWWGLIFVRVLQGTASAMVWPVGEALVVDSVPVSKRSRSISIYIFLTNLGAVAGPLAGGGILFWAQDMMGWDTLAAYRLPFYFTSGIALFGAVVGLFLLRDVIEPSVDREKAASDEREAMASIPTRVRRSLNMLYANSFFEGIAMTMGGVVMVFFMNENFGMGARDFSLLSGGAQAMAMTVLVPTGILTDHLPRKPFIVYGTIGSRFTMLLMSISMLFPYGMIVAVSTFIMKDMGLFIASPATRSLQADLAPVKVRGRMLGTIQAVSNLGAVVGPIVGGLMWDMYHERVFSVFGFPLHGDSLPILIASVLGLIPAYLILRYVWEPKRAVRGIGPLGIK